MTERDTDATLLRRSVEGLNKLLEQHGQKSVDLHDLKYMHDKDVDYENFSVSNASFFDLRTAIREINSFHAKGADWIHVNLITTTAGLQVLSMFSGTPRVEPYHPKVSLNCSFQPQVFSIED